jgi:hypothetical protein
MEAHPRTWIGVSVDIKNAFSSVDHKAVETALVTAGGNMKLALGFFRQMCSATQPPSLSALLFRPSSPIGVDRRLTRQENAAC